MIFQDPYSSLNGRMTVGEIIGEPLQNFGAATAPRRARDACASCSRRWAWPTTI